MFFFFFSSRRRHTRCSRDWSSDVCSSDLLCTHMHKQHNGHRGPLVVLAYSGGLDTSAIVPWLRETYGARVVCFAADVGQGAGELKGLVEKAKRSGAEDCIVEDLREEFVRDF